MHTYPIENNESKGTWCFIFILLHLLVEFARPQSVLPIGFLRPGLIITIALALCLIVSSSSLKLDKQINLIFFFIILLGLHIPFATNNYYAFAAFTTMAIQVPFLLAFILFINSEKRLIVVLKTLAIILFYLSLYAVLHGGRGPGGSVGDENDLSLFLLTFSPFILPLFVRAKTVYRIFLIIILLLIIFAIVSAFSRGAFVGLIALLAVLFWYSPRKILSLTFGALCLSLIFYFGGQEYSQEMSTITDLEESTADARILSWKTAWKMFLDNPLGVGGYNFPVLFQHYQLEGFTRGMWGRVSHSLWFTLLPELGIPGVFIYFLLIKRNVKDIFKLKKSQKTEGSPNHFLMVLFIAFIGSFAAFFSTASFLSVLYYPHFWFLTVLVVAVRKIYQVPLNSHHTIPN